MDNFRRHSFGFSQDEIQGTAFTKWRDISDIRIKKLYVPMIPMSISNESTQNAYSLANYNGKAGSGNPINISFNIHKSDGTTTTGSQYVYYNNRRMNSSTISGTASSLNFGYYPGGNNGLIRYFLAGGKMWTGVFACNFSSDSTVTSKQWLIESFQASFGIDYVPYMCIDFTLLKFSASTSVHVDYVTFNTSSGSEYYTTTILKSPLDQEFPFYYEEYTE